MSPDDVFALLVTADPVPDGSDATTLAPVLERLRLPDDGSPPMTLTTTEPTGSASGSSGPRRWALAAVAATIVVLGVAAFVLTRDDSSGEPADPPVQSLPAVPTAEQVAIATARTYVDALTSGDTGAALAMTNVAASNLDADRHMIEMQGVTNDSFGAPIVGPCTADGALDAWIDVRCEFISTDPVWVELGVDQLVFPVRVYEDGSAKWLPFEGADFNAANWAYADYLQAFHPDEYEAACRPASYPVGSVYISANTVLTGSCAELSVALADDVVQWIRDGRPSP